MKRIFGIILSVVMLLAGPKIDSVAAEIANGSDESFEESVDTFFSDKMQEYDIPGAAVVVVENGKVVLEKSYGVADRKKNITFTDDTTFRIASITKTFTATGLMQLVQEGKVKLDEDILTYLPDLKIKNPYGKPITVENLLSYTSGLDSSILLELSHEKVDMSCGYLLAEMNKKNLTVISEPGTHIQYCSYGVVLEGCIIEAVTGESCADYISKHILQPLDMKNTKMSMTDKGMSKGYLHIEKQLKEYTMDGCFKLYPEGGLLSSVSDMGKYVQMFLNNGKYMDRQVLFPKTAEGMLKQASTYDTLLPGMCYGFGEYDEQGVRIVGHGGYAPDGKVATGKIRNRIWDTCFVGISILYLAILNYWNLFGFRY